MHNALWNPVFFVIDSAEKSEVTLGLNGYIFEFDCLFVHGSILNGAVRRRGRLPREELRSSL